MRTLLPLRLTGGSRDYIPIWITPCEYMAVMIGAIEKCNFAYILYGGTMVN